MSPGQGDRDFYPSSEDQWISLARLRELIAEVEESGIDRITPVDLINRLGIEDDELDLLKSLRYLRDAARGGHRAPNPYEGRRRARDELEG
jgi:hypothetical protein